MKKLLMGMVSCLMLAQMFNVPLMAMQKKEHDSDEETAEWGEGSYNDAQDVGRCACCRRQIQQTYDALQCLFWMMAGCCAVCTGACQGFCQGLCEDCCKREKHDHARRV